MTNVLVAYDIFHDSFEHMTFRSSTSWQEAVKYFYKSKNYDDIGFIYESIEEADCIEHVNIDDLRFEYFKVSYSSIDEV